MIEEVDLTVESPRPTAGWVVRLDRKRTARKHTGGKE
jgi:hypothetical protein